MANDASVPVPDLPLNNGRSIPQLGFGVFEVPADQTRVAVSTALAAGYRHIDTAKLYDNEEGVAAAVADSGIARDDLFITTKLWNTEQGYDSTLRWFDTSLKKLELDVLDLYLIHWPCPTQDLYVETWKALEQLAADGRVRSIGVSNFNPVHLQRLLDETDVVPVLNQVELHPWLQQRELREFHAKHDILTEAWSPLARGGDFLNNETIAGIAAKQGKSVAQVILRWHVQVGNVVIPRSVTPSRVAENFEIFDFALDSDDLAAITALDNGTRIGPDPDTFG